jgi:undecaprenyl-phosphate 4-deoxy-4-formamido-L-arabinose transferase
LSIVIPVYNEERNLPELHQRLEAVLDGMGSTWEVIYVDDGSTDRGPEVLMEVARRRPGAIRVIELFRNAGQFNALAAGFERTRGAIVVTLDSDLQNPPEEIPRLVELIRQGYDVVNGWRRDRQDSGVRRAGSRVANWIAARTTGVRVRDYGCMLRAYRREIVEQVAACREHHIYVPTLANAFARRVAEIEVEHAARRAGASKYPLGKLVNLQYDLMTSFSTLPLRMLTLIGAAIAALAAGLGLFLALRRLLAGTGSLMIGGLLAAQIFLIGILFVALGLVGEYVGRIYLEVRRRPRYIVRREYGAPEAAAAEKAGSIAGLGEIDAAGRT